jgi:Putative peptidoglycan binding domain
MPTGPNGLVQTDNPSELLDVKGIVLHETTRGNMDDSEPGRFTIPQTNVRADQQLSINTDFVILQNGRVYQENQNTNDHPNRQSSTIGRGTGTQTEDREGWLQREIPHDRRIPKGSVIDIEVDYRSQSTHNQALNEARGLDYAKESLKSVAPIKDDQYIALARTVVDTVKLKQDAMTASGHPPKPGESILVVLTHREMDRGLSPKAHVDPSEFDYKKFQQVLNSEMQKQNLSPNLVKLSPEINYQLGYIQGSRPQTNVQQLLDVDRNDPRLKAPIPDKYSNANDWKIAPTLDQVRGGRAEIHPLMRDERREVTTNSQDAVVKIQRMVGMPADRQTGKYGDETMKAVEDFQRKHGLQPNGIVGKDTLNALERAYNRRSELPTENKTADASASPKENSYLAMVNDLRRQVGEIAVSQDHNLGHNPNRDLAQSTPQMSPQAVDPGLGRA